MREMQGACDHLQHQLSIALNDRNLLLEQLRTLAGAEWRSVLVLEELGSNSSGRGSLCFPGGNLRGWTLHMLLPTLNSVDCSAPVLLTNVPMHAHPILPLVLLALFVFRRLGCA